MCHCVALASNVPTVTTNVPQRRQQHFLRNADVEMTIFKKRLDKRLKLATLSCVCRRSTQLLVQKSIKDTCLDLLDCRLVMRARQPGASLEDHH